MSEKRRLAVLTTGRQDYGILRSTLLRLRADPRFDLRLWVGGMHLAREFGHTVERIGLDGLTVDREIPILAERSNLPAEAARAITGVAAAIESARPDALVVLGDRYETLAAAFAAALARVPIVHLYGGEETEGAIDNALRHAITKLSHLHLVSHSVHARRVLQMGEPAETVHVVGAAGLDNLYREDLPDRDALERHLGIALKPPVVTVTLHPTTLGGDPALEVRAVATAMERVPATYVITNANSDAGGDVIRAFWKTWAAGRSHVVLVDALGETLYFGLLRVADAVLGNSSSGLVEAPAVGLPVVNVGDRQAGRLRSDHVIDVPPDAAAIGRALGEALEPGARARFAAMASLFPGGPSAARIVEALARWRIPEPPRKQFQDLPGVGS